MKLLVPDRMKRYDEFAIETWGIPSAVLMENAGRTSYRLLKDEYLRPGSRLAVFCGRGNNGGDGFVIARYAFRDGFDTTVYLLGRPEELKGDALLNMNLYGSIGGTTVSCPDNLDEARNGLREAHIVIDAIFGTGLSKEVGGVEREAIEAINGSAARVIAVDVPSGLDAARGVPLGTAVRAHHTYTFGYGKTGHLLYEGPAHTGRLTVIDISLPGHAEDELGIDAYGVDGDMLRGFIKRRSPASHKGSYGHVVVIAGSAGKTGAACMASEAALRIGAGLVTLVIPRSLNPIVAAKLTEVMTFPVDDGGMGSFPLSAFDPIMEFMEGKDVCIMGPGLSTSPETMELVRKLYEKAQVQFVIDADGVNSFDGHLSLLNHKAGRAILTPHPGEFGRLTAMGPRQVNEDRLAVGSRFVQDHGVDLVLKGAGTTIFSRDKRIFINPTGNPALAKGGTGDILTGLIGGLVAQGYSLTEAAMFGVYLHGYSADTWVETHTSMDMVAGDILSGLSEALRDIGDGTDRIYVSRSL